ncbi:peptidoglycan bridge formation glycyltransferase FemA/FemB family protein [Patescibacteria group bacterium]|nr:peptidoglycan bridge formation glycyltransferase FemA/FemB family protein [Patescibacteria group bacterium]MBU1895357.1 peptidoglycan bridge formation glycyltransferase FemA/FemB family protein [Patescibacteria group bacterium]
MYEIKQIENRLEWTNFLAHQPYTLFVQSPEYGEFYKSLGEEYYIFGIYEDQKLVGGSLVVSVHAQRGNFLFLPYGPVLDFNNKEILTDLTNHLKKFAKSNNYDFIRVSPFASTSKDRLELFKSLRFRPAPMHILAETTWLLNVTSNEEKLLSEMKKNHRNLISRCNREGVRVEIKNDKESLEEFNQLHDETAKKHSFHRFSREYIYKEFSAFNEIGSAVIFQAFLPDGRLDASAIIMYYGNTAAYRHAASRNLDKKIPTSYMIQWEAIKEAKRRGIKWYNFWGISPEDAPKNHPFHGITHFKKGFGGEQKDLINCHDLPITKLYWINWIIESIRRKKRGF